MTNKVQAYKVGNETSWGVWFENNKNSGLARK